MNYFPTLCLDDYPEDDSVDEEILLEAETLLGLHTQQAN